MPCRIGTTLTFCCFSIHRTFMTSKPSQVATLPQGVGLAVVVLKAGVETVTSASTHPGSNCYQRPGRGLPPVSHFESISQPRICMRVLSRRLIQPYLYDGLSWSHAPFESRGGHGSEHRHDPHPLRRATSRSYLCGVRATN